MGLSWRDTGTGILTAIMLVWPALAGAVEWALVPERSNVTFEYARNGKPAEGRFAHFRGEGKFSPDAPGAATLELRIESASIDLGDPLASAFATSVEWFDAANHPVVIYRLASLVPLGADRYEATGELTIRGRTRPVSSTITLVVDDASARAEGLLKLDRIDYRLGVGPSALFIEIGREVAVRFDLTALPVR